MSSKFVRLAAGGKWIRTIGTWKISYSFDTDFCRLRDGFGAPRRWISSAHMRCSPRAPSGMPGDRVVMIAERSRPITCEKGMRVIPDLPYGEARKAI
jgi:hypothetical protein